MFKLICCITMYLLNIKTWS
uniref:Uncharacterized protein n=1 Tax=Anguilla anguilla TaxID=7936 RepID=A0A0E9T7L7_ANGAN